MLRDGGEPAGRVEAAGGAPVAADDGGGVHEVRGLVDREQLRQLAHEGLRQVPVLLPGHRLIIRIHSSTPGFCGGGVWSWLSCFDHLVEIELIFLGNRVYGRQGVKNRNTKNILLFFRY